MSRLFIVHRSSFIVLLALSCAQRQPPRHEVHRVVSLAPNVTEMLYAVGAGPSIVGTDNFSDYPEAVKRLPKVGGVEPDIEKIVALHPDLVVASASGVHPSLRRALAAVGLPLLVIRTDRLQDIQPAMAEIGRATGTDPRPAIATVTTVLAAERRTRRHRPRVLFAVWTDPLYVAGRGTFAGDLLDLTGAQNAAETNGWPQYPLERFAAHPPDLLLYPNRSVTRPAAEALLRRAHAKTEAVAVEEDVFTRPGPRLTEAAAQLDAIFDRWERSH